MKFQDLKIGDQITHYCFGLIVTGAIIHKDNARRHIITEHEPVQWGRETYVNTDIWESSPLQKKWGGTDKHGQPCKGKDTTPAAWYNGQEIII